jgi:branched-chain amino acid transport system substrate-binding protein
MKRNRYCILVVALLVAISAALSGCTTYTNFKETFLTVEDEESDVVKIGVFEPLSGKDKEYGELEKRGIELAHELYPEVLGKKVELVFADNQSDVDVAATVARELVDKKVSVVLGSYGSTLSLAGGEYFAKAKIPAIAVTSTNPLVTGSNEYYFRACFVESFQGIALAKYAVEEMGVSKAAIFKDVDDDYAAAVSQTFSDKFAALTQDENSIAKIIEYQTKTKDFSKQLNEVKASGAEVILMAGKTTDAIEIMKQAKEAGTTAVFLGTNDWETDKFLEKGGENVEGAVFATFFDSESNLTEITDVFLKAYREKYGKDATPESNVALGFDAYLLAINAITNAGLRIGKRSKQN